MEIASYLIDKASSITVIGSSEMPYQSTLGPEIGRVTMMVRRRNRISNFTGTVFDFVASADADWKKCEILHERQRAGGQRAGREGEGSGAQKCKSSPRRCFYCGHWWVHPPAPDDYICFAVLNQSQIILAKLDIWPLDQNVPHPHHQSLLQWLFL